MIKIERKKGTVIKNTVSLTLMQATNYLLPLMTLPYLARVLGPDNFGKVFFAQMLIQYFIIIADYGFTQIGVRQVAKNNHNKRKLKLIVSSIYTLRLTIAVLGFFLLVIIVNIFQNFEDEKLLYYFSYGMVVGNILMPSWFFQGIQQMKFITMLNFLSKMTFTILIFVVVKDKNDYMLVPLLNTTGFIVSGALAIAIMKYKYSVAFEITPFRIIKLQLKSGFNMFITNLSITSSANTNGFILGNITSNEVMGYYGGMEKIVQTIRFMFTPIYSALYPYFLNLQLQNRSKFIKESKFVFIFSGLMGIGIFILVLYFTEEIIILVLGRDYLAGKNIFHIYSILIVVTPLSYFVFNVLFLSLSLERISMKIYLFGGFFNLLVLLILLNLLENPSISAVLANVITQVILLMIASKIISSHMLATK